MLTIAKINANSVEYYESTVTQSEGRAAAFDSVDYYSEGGDAVPRAFVLGRDTGSASAAALLEVGVSDGQLLEGSEARNWFTELRSIDGERALGKRPPATHTRTLRANDPKHRRSQKFAASSDRAMEEIANAEMVGKPIKETRQAVCGYDLTFAAPKSVSLLWMGSDEHRGTIERAHAAAVQAGLTYLSRRTYSRVHDPVATAELGRQIKTQVPLTTFAGATYEHKCSRAGDPHIHTHALLSNRQVRADGGIGAIDGTALYHEARAAGVVYQAALRLSLSESLGVEWAVPEEQSGMADIAGFDRKVIDAWSRRHTEMHEWAAQHQLAFKDQGSPTSASLAVAQKATRTAKKSQPLDVTRAGWQSDGRATAIDLSENGGILRRRTHLSEGVDSLRPDPATVLSLIAQTKSTFSRQDVVEAVGTLWPTATSGGHGGDDSIAVLDQIEEAADEVLSHELCLLWSTDPQLIETGQRRSWEREAAVRYTSQAVVHEEQQALETASEWSDERALSLTDDQVDTVLKGRLVSEEQRSAIRAIATSGNTVTALVAPAGAGKTTGVMSPLADIYRRAGYTVIGAAPSGRASDGMRQERVVEAAHTTDSLLNQIASGRVELDQRTVVLLDEAGMVGNGQLSALIAAARARGGKIIAVGDHRQLSPVKARGGLFGKVAADAADTVELTEVFRQIDPDERQAGLMLRDGSQDKVTEAAQWYADKGLLQIGSVTAMSQDAFCGWRNDMRSGKRSLLLAQGNDAVDQLNIVAQQTDRKERWARANIGGFAGNIDRARDAIDRAGLAAPSRVAKLGYGQMKHEVAVGEPILTRNSLFTVSCLVTDEYGNTRRAGPVRNGQLWVVMRINDDGSVVAQRTDDEGAVAVLPADYLQNSAQLGYAGTIHSAQGATADTMHCLLDVMTAQKEMSYVAATRGREANHIYLFERVAGEAAEQHRPIETGSDERCWRGTHDDARDGLVSIMTRSSSDVTAAEALESDAMRVQLDHQLERTDRDRDLGIGKVHSTVGEQTLTRQQNRKADSARRFGDNLRRQADRKRMVAANRQSDQERGMSL